MCRIQISAETFLIEAENRGKVLNRDVNAHIVGLGLGVWLYSKKQVSYYLQAFELAITNMVQCNHKLKLKSIDFSWIDCRHRFSY